MSEQTIGHATLVKLVDAGTVRAAHVIGRMGSWGMSYRMARRRVPLLRNGEECGFPPSSAHPVRGEVQKEPNARLQ